MQTTLLRLVSCLVLLIVPLQTLADEQANTFEPYEAWYVLKLGGQRSGHMHASLREEDGKLINQSSMVIAIKRGETELRIEQASTFIETLDYTPIRSKSSMKLALMATEQEIDFTGDQWTLTTKNAGQQSQNNITPPDIDWLTPGAMATYLKQAMDNGDDTITVTTLDPSAGVTPVTIEMKRDETKDIEVFGKTIPATKWVTTMSATPGIEIEQWTDETGQPVKQMIPLMPGMEIEMLLADKELALAEFDAPEMLAASFIKPDKPIKNPRKLKRAVFDLVSEGLKEEIGDTVPNAGYQTTKWVDDNTLRVEIDLGRRVFSGKPEPDGAMLGLGGGLDKVAKENGLKRDDYINHSSMLNYQDEAIKALAKGTFENWFGGDSITPLSYYNAARDARDVVREHIQAKDLSVGFASASEVARTKQGDCTEHAVLLAAILRSMGIPSRTVTGLVYADQFAGHEGIFGFHMWTQAWVQNPFADSDQYRWLDLDAALPGDINSFDATHIALSTSAMKDGESFNEMVTLLPLMQGMKIKVIELEWAE